MESTPVTGAGDGGSGATVRDGTAPDGVAHGGAARDGIPPEGSPPGGATSGGTEAAPALAEDYYVRSFLTVLDTVETRHRALLDGAERRWAAALRAAPEPSRRLYVRLVTRRAAAFRLSKLRYREIPDVGSAVAGLVEAGLADEEAPRALGSLLGAFTAPEIERLLDVPAGAGPRRAERVAALLARGASADAAALAAADAWVRPLGFEHFAVFRLCFFGNLHQDLSEFAASDLGAARYERYPLDAAAGHFATREQVERHLRHRECEIAHELGDRTDPEALRALLACLPRPFPGDRLLGRRLDRLRNAIGRDLERLGLAAEALFVYAGTERPPARERRVRLLVSGERGTEASALCREILDAPRSEAEAEFAERALAGLARAAAPRRADGSRVPRPRPWRPATSVLTLADDGTRVERAARAYYARSGACHWLENRLVRAALGLFVWDIVFADVPGAFFNPFQSAPADFREGFREARRDALDARLAELDAPDGRERLERRVLATLAARRGVANPLVRWGRVSPAVLRLALGRIPPAHWKALFDRMLDDLAEHVSGLPDLVRFPHAGGYEFIEIKGPGDALQRHQRRWLRHLERHGIPARVVRVRRPPARPRTPAGAAPRPGMGGVSAPPPPDVPGLSADLFADLLPAPDGAVPRRGEGA